MGHGSRETFAKIRKLLVELHELRPCTIAVSNTRIGKTVKKFTKCSDSTVRELAMKLTSTWIDELVNDDAIVNQIKREIKVGYAPTRDRL